MLHNVCKTWSYAGHVAQTHIAKWGHVRKKMGHAMWPSQEWTQTCSCQCNPDILLNETEGWREREKERARDCRIAGVHTWYIWPYWDSYQHGALPSSFITSYQKFTISFVLLLFFCIFVFVCFHICTSPLWPCGQVNGFINNVHYLSVIIIEKLYSYVAPPNRYGQCLVFQLNSWITMYEREMVQCFKRLEGMLVGNVYCKLSVVRYDFQ